MFDRSAEGLRQAQAADGTLVVRRGGGPGGAGLRNGRLVGPEAAVRGCPAEAAPRLLARLLPVCGWAQGIACRRAVEAAEGRPAVPAAEAARARLLLGETALAQLWRVAIDWPALIPCPADVAPLRAGRAALAALVAACWPGGDPLAPGAAAADPNGAAAAGGAAARLADLLDGALAGIPEEPAQLAGWAGAADHALAGLLRRAGGLCPGPGLMAADPLPSFAAVAARLAADTAFGAAPQNDGQPGEPGALDGLEGSARAALAPLGPLAGRLAAMLLGMRRTAARLRMPPAPAPAPSATRIAPDWGAGTAETARGPLVHLVRIAGGRIEGFRSVAPTEWLLHPAGALRRCLDALPADAGEGDIRLAVAAFDPCATVVIAGGHDGHA